MSGICGKRGRVTYGRENDRQEKEKASTQEKDTGKKEHAARAGRQIGQKKICSWADDLVAATGRGRVACVTSQTAGSRHLIPFI